MYDLAKPRTVFSGPQHEPWFCIAKHCAVQICKRDSGGPGLQVRQDRIDLVGVTSNYVPVASGDVCAARCFVGSADRARSLCHSPGELSSFYHTRRWRLYDEPCAALLLLRGF